MSFKHGQCAAATAKGAQCQSGTMEGDMFCGPHRTQADEGKVKIFAPVSDHEVKVNQAASWKDLPEDTKKYVREAAQSLPIKEESKMTMEEYDDQFWSETREDYNFIFSVTGSRSLQTAPRETQNAVMEYMRSEFRRLKEKYGKILLVTGMAEGFDALAARVAQLENVDYVAAIPNKGYGDYYWGRKSKTERNRLVEFNDYLEKAVQVIYVCEKLYVDGVHSNFVRNQYMVDNAQGFYVWNKTSRGTKDCVDRIEKADLPYIEVKI